jgi:hypothetical protein
MFPIPRTNLRMAQIIDAAIRLRSHHRQHQAVSLLLAHAHDTSFIERVLSNPHQRRVLSRL